MADEILKLENVSKQFGDLKILEGVSLVLSAGDSVAVVGPSGAGKSTLLHIAGLMEKPSHGVVSIEGQTTGIMSELDKARRRLDAIGFLFQFHHLLPDFNVLENVLMPFRLAGESITVAEEEAKNLLDRLGLSARLHHRPFQLSGGEQQRAALARAIIRKPKLLLCDEPTGNLDQSTGQDIIELISGEIKNRKLSSIIVTHNLKIAKQADRIFSLEQGHLIEKNKVEIA